MTSINTYDPARFPEWWADPPLPIVALVVGTLNLLEEAADLPQPRHLSVSGGGQEIALQFGDARSIAQWARRFGDVLTSTPIEEDSKGPRNICRAVFDYHGICAEAYAIIPAATAAT